MVPKQKIGLMCGTFNPPHIGHLILAQTAFHNLNLDLVLFLPVGDPTHKSTHTASRHRLEMTRLAIHDNQNFQLSSADIDRPPPHYTATLLPLLRNSYPNASFWLIMGGDSLASFHLWHEPEQILNHCRLAVLARPGYTSNNQGQDAKLQIPTLTSKVDQLDGPSIDLSSSLIRKQIQARQKPKYLIPESVQVYAETHELYTK